MIFGPGGRDHGPQKQLFLALDPPNYSKYSKNKSKSFLEYVIVGNVKALNSNISKMMENLGPINSEDPSYKFLGSLNMGSRSINKHELEI